MPFAKATPPKLPATIGLVALTVSTNAAGEAVIGTGTVQVLDGGGREYERNGGDITAQLSAPVLAKVQEAIDAVRTQSTSQILAP